MRPFALAMGAVCVAFAGLAAADNWTQFRGDNASGLAPSSAPLPTEFSDKQNVVWSAKVGTGIASPVISNGRVFVTSMSGPQTFKVLCFDSANGKPIWSKELETGALPAITPPNTPASSTPAVDDENLYVYVSTLGLISFRVKDGEEVWRRPIQQPFYLMTWGAASSPILYKDLVIFNQDDDLDATLFAFDKKTGSPRWQTKRPEMLAGYALPVLCTANGRTDLVVAGSGKMKGYDPANGKELWTCNTLLRIIMTTPVVHDDTIYISVQSFGDADRLLRLALLEWKDTNRDGKLSKDEIPREFWDKFDKGDKNHDGFLEGDEIDAAFQSPSNMVGGGNIIQAIKGGGSGDVTKTHLVWSKSNKCPSDIASPLYSNGRLFLVKTGGIASLFDAKDGSPLYMLKRINNLGTYFASPIAGDGKIFVTGENGFIVVLADSPKLEILAKNDMGDNCIATPAIANGRLYVRTKESLFCIGK